MLKMCKIKDNVLLLFLCVTINFFAVGQEEDTICRAFKTDTIELSQVISYIEILEEIDSKYLNLVFSLSDNMNIMHFEKMQYFLNLDKFLKFKISKDLYKYEDKNLQHTQAKRFTQLKNLNQTIRVKIQSLEERLKYCMADTNIQRYIEKRTLIEELDAHYFIKYINLVNITIDYEKINYEELYKLELQMLTKLVDARNFLVNKLSDRNSTVVERKITLYDELIAQYRIRVQESNFEKSRALPEEVKAQTNVSTETYSVMKVVTDYKKYFSEQNINIEEVIIINNEIYVSRNDSLIKIINKGNENSQAGIEQLKSTPISVEDYDGLFYTIQIGTFAKEKSFADLNVQSNLFYKVLPNGNYRYSFGMFKDSQQAEKLLGLLKTLGIKETVIIAYNKGERISIREANKLSSSGK